MRFKPLLQLVAKTFESHSLCTWHSTVFPVWGEAVEHHVSAEGC